MEECKLWFRSSYTYNLLQCFQSTHFTFGVTNFKKYRASSPSHIFFNDAAESHIMWTNSVFKSAYLN